MDRICHHVGMTFYLRIRIAHRNSDVGMLQHLNVIATIADAQTSYMELKGTLAIGKRV